MRSKEQAFLSRGSNTFFTDTSPDFLIIIAFPGSNSMTSSKATLNTV
jgi:hypothetical protein